MDEADKNKRNRREKSHTHIDAATTHECEYIELNGSKVLSTVNENVDYRFATLCKFAF